MLRQFFVTDLEENRDTGKDTNTVKGNLHEKFVARD